MTIHQSILLDEPRGLAVLDACDYYRLGTIITRINVPAAHRGKGHGRAMLARACKEADTIKETLWLEVAAYTDSPMDNDQLREWYGRYGFVDFGGILKRNAR